MRLRSGLLFGVESLGDNGVGVNRGRADGPAQAVSRQVYAALDAPRNINVA